jgi:hypothetical protein
MINPIMVFIGSCGVSISVVYIFMELFTTIDGLNFSIKKIYGFSVVADINFFLIFGAFGAILESSLLERYVELVFLFFFNLILIKFYIAYSLLPIIKETREDNLKRLGGFKNKYSLFGWGLLTAGLLIIIFLGGIPLFNSSSMIFTNETMVNSVSSMIYVVVFFIYTIYLLINIIIISSFHVNIYLKEREGYLKDNETKSLKKYNSFPLLVILILIIILNFLFIIRNETLIILFSSLIY